MRDRLRVFAVGILAAALLITPSLAAAAPAGASVFAGHVAGQVVPPSSGAANACGPTAPGYVAAGEQARFLGKLPFKLATFDREFGYVPLTVSQPDIARFMVVRPCSLLDALLYIFDTLWERATPITFGPGSPPGEPDSGDDPPDSRLLNLLATGMTDQAIAHHLGLSYRTTRRRIAALMTELGAESRFQAGLQASRRGWLLPAPPSVQRPAARAVQLRRQLVTMKARISAS
jgi:DNA-binding CsgD family transcriptional regulator